MTTPMFKRIKRLMLIMGVLLSPAAAFASTGTPDSCFQIADSVSINANEDVARVKGVSSKPSKFTWGAEFGTSIDMSGYDSSTFNIDAMVGYRNSYFRIIGAGVGIHRSLGSGDNYIPVYAVMRTSFSKQPKLFFMSLKVGYSFNTIGDAPMFGDTNASLGAGINLAIGESFKSYIILGYEFRHFNKRHRDSVSIDAEDVSLVTLSFGVNF